MSAEGLEEALIDTFKKRERDPPEFGEYHPSQVSGCPLKVFLNRMTNNKTELNSWLFQGSAVHYFMQDTGRLTEALAEVGYHPVTTSFEVPISYDIGDGAEIHGTCDVLARDGKRSAIYDLKYSSVSMGSGRMYSYMSQANTYAHMFDVDEYGLIVIPSNRQADSFFQDMNVLTNELSEENFEIVKDKVLNIHEALQTFGADKGKEFELSKLIEAEKDFWKNVMRFFEESRCPAYEKECNYCDHEEYCPVQQGKLGGVRGLIND